MESYIVYWIDKQHIARKTCTLANSVEEAQSTTAYIYNDFGKHISAEKGTIDFGFKNKSK